MQKTKIRIGTRGSKLALIQAEMVSSALGKCRPGITTELVVIKTQGDKLLNTPLAAMPDKGVFIKEIEESLLKGEVDLAVHSLKDLPTELPAPLVLAAVLKREDPRDVFVSRNGQGLEALAPGSVVLTSSLRRRAQLMYHFPGLEMQDIRGNVETRIAKLRAGAAAGVVLAAAGIIRSGLGSEISAFLSPQLLVPAVCQGIIGIETRADDPEVRALADAINHLPTYTTALAERAFLKRLEGGCRVPIGCYTETAGTVFCFTGLIAAPAGKVLIKETLTGAPEQAVELALQAAELLLAKGGEAVLREIRKLEVRTK